MSGRVLVMTGSLLLAGGVLGTAAWLGAAPPSDDGKPAPGQPVPNSALTPTDLAELNIRPEDLTGGQRMEPELIEVFEVYQDDGETITRLYGTEAVPSDNFVADVRGPGVEIIFAPEEVLTITAAAGTFYYPGDQPKRGNFHRDTVVTLYKARPGETVDLKSDRHVQMRLFLDEPTHFDREHGQVRTDGPVRLVGRNLDFTGRGLSLSFNAGQQRVEQLVIDSGDQLRMAAGGPLTPDNPEPNTADADPTPIPPGTPAPPRPAAEPDTADAAPAADPGQTYLLTLDGGVDVAMGADGIALHGQTLRGTFVDRSDDDDADDKNTKNTGADTPTPADAGIQASIAADAPQPTAPQTAAAPAPQAPAPINANDPRALRHPQPDDIVVAWGGRLVLTPDPATDAAGGAGGGTRLVLAGSAAQPAQVITGEAQRIEAAQVGYDHDTRRVWAHGENPDALDGPGITLIAPDAGRLIARDLELDPDAGVGVVGGPGRLATDDGRLAVAFAERLNLSFITSDQDARDNDALDRFTGLREAVFVGAVEADATDEDGQPSLSLRADRLAVPFTRDAAEPQTRGAEPEAELRPAALIASVDPSRPDSAVTVTLPDTHFRAQELTVDLVRAKPVPPAQATATAQPGENDSDLGDLDVARVRARGTVSVRLEDGEAQITAHALDADPNQHRLELFGQDNTSAVMMRRGARLSGQHMILRETEQAVEVLGAGHFSVPTDEADPNAEMRVAWSDGMTFENRAGRAFFTGDVVADSNTAESHTELKSHTMAIDFAPQDLDQLDLGQQDPGTENAKDPASKPGDTTNALDIRRVHALADPQDRESLVNFTTQTLDPDADAASQAAPLTEFTLTSRELDFVNVVPNRTNRTAVDDHLTLQTVTVPGRGRMVISDYRTPAPTDERAVAFAGAGLTAFDWQGRLELDALHNDLRIEGDVIMVHLPLADPGASPEPPVKLETQVITADLTETGGLGALAGDPAPEVQLNRVVATGAVVLTQDQNRALADHLDYAANRGTVILTAEPGKLCEVRNLDQPGATTTAHSLIWNLDNGVFSANVRGVGGVVPIE